MILVTGCAGFIGFHVCKQLLESGVSVKGIDNINSYYSTDLKHERLKILQQFANFQFAKIDIQNMVELMNFSKDVTSIIHLAAQAGVRYSIENPTEYVNSNLIGFFNILELSKTLKVQKLVYASSSSVYGMSKKFPLSVDDKTDSPISFYAATKKSNEVMAESYNSLYKIPMVGLRFFTVYGEYGRPDMAPYKFIERVNNGETIEVYNNGEMLRDFTYVDDIVAGIISSHKLNLNSEHRIYNLGNNEPVQLKYFIQLIEQNLGKKANIKYLPMQPGDVMKTCADIEKSITDLGYIPKTSIEEGIANTVNWHILRKTY